MGVSTCHITIPAGATTHQSPNSQVLLDCKEETLRLVCSQSLMMRDLKELLPTAVCLLLLTAICFVDADTGELCIGSKTAARVQCARTGVFAAALLIATRTSVRKPSLVVSRQLVLAASKQHPTSQSAVLFSPQRLPLWRVCLCEYGIHINP